MVKYLGFSSKSGSGRFFGKKGLHKREMMRSIPTNTLPTILSGATAGNCLSFTATKLGELFGDGNTNPVKPAFELFWVDG